MSKKKKKYFIQDKVLTNSDADFFRHRDLSENIANIINNDNYKTPYNIALIGKWGLGKSSLLKFIEPQISKDCMMFTINAWKYEKESLKKKFLKSIYEEITKKKNRTFDSVLEFVSKLLKKDKDVNLSFWQKVKKWLSNYWGFILLALAISLVYSMITAVVHILANQIDITTYFSAGWFVGFMKFANYYFNNLSENFLLPLLVMMIGIPLTNIFEKIRTPINIEIPINDADDYEVILKIEIEKLLKKHTKKKIVIVIDDLDRLSTSKIVEALDTLKSLMEINDCIFIVSFDDTLIKNALEKKVVSQVDSEHQTIRSELILDKLFQFKFYLAPLIKSDIKDYTIEMIRAEASDFASLFEVDGIDYFEEIIKKTVIYNGIETPRQIKKIVNVLSNNLLILRERCKNNVTENNLLSKDGLFFLAKLSVLQADFNDFFDTLYVDNNNMENLLKIHETPIVWEDIPYELKFLFENKSKSNKGMSKIKKEHEIIINFLFQTRSISSNNIRAYLYLNQDKLSVKYGSEFNTRITNAIESSNVITSLELINDSKNDLNELLFEILEDTQQEQLNASLISFYGIIQTDKKVENRLLVLLSEKTEEYYKQFSDFSNINLLKLDNLFFVYNELNSTQRNGTELLLCNYLDSVFDPNVTSVDKLMSLINYLISNESMFSLKLKEQVKKCIDRVIVKEKAISVDYFINNTNLFSKEQFRYYLGLEFYNMLCENLGELPDDKSIDAVQSEWLSLAVDSIIEIAENKNKLLTKISPLYKKQSNMKVLNDVVIKYWGDNNE